MNSDYKVVITGASGFLGLELSRKLKNLNISTYLSTRSENRLDGDESLDLLLRDADIVYHFAAISAGSGYTPNSTDIVKNNIDTTYDLIRAIRRYSNKVPILVLISSIHVYARPLGEVTEESKLGPVSIYGMSKLMQEIIIRQAGDDGIVTPIIFRASNIYGPGAKSNYNSAIATFCHQVKDGDEIKLFSNGRSLIDLIYVEDVINYLLKVDNLEYGGIYNLSSGVSVSIKEVIDILSSISKKNIKTKMIDSPFIDFLINNNKLRKLCPDVLLTPIATGLNETYKNTK
jgi:nucleoside-diphosphate-sugar epimerase